MPTKKLFVQPLTEAVKESTALGRSLIVAKAAQDLVSTSRQEHSGRREIGGASSAIARSIPTAALRIVNPFSSNLFFKIQTKSANDFCCKRENGVIRAKSAVIVAVAYTGSEDGVGVSDHWFRCRWGSSEADAKKSCKFQLKFHETYVSADLDDGSPGTAAGSGGTRVSAAGSSSDNAGQISNRKHNTATNEASQKGWPPWERTNYSGNELSSEDVDSERAAAYNFIAATEASIVKKDSMSAAVLRRNATNEAGVPYQTTSCCQAMKSIVIQAALVFSVLWLLVFAAPERTGGLAGVFTWNSPVLPSFCCGMIAQALRGYCANHARSSRSGRKYKAE